MHVQANSKEAVINPSAIIQTGLAFWSSKVLLTAVSLDLFSFLSEGSKTAEQVQHVYGLHRRGLYDFLDALVALNFLNRDGFKEHALYSNTLETETFLDRKKPSYIGGMLVMANNRLYPFWNNLEEALKTGLPQNEAKNGGQSMFEALYEDENRLEEFLSAMGAFQRGNFISFSKQFDFSNFKSHCDIGGAGAELSIQIAGNQPHMHTITFDLPKAAPIARRNIYAAGVNNRVKIVSGDFFTDDFPNADIITMGNILHDWDLKEKKALIGKAYGALPPGGAFVVIENIIDNDRAENATGLLMSLNMLIETNGGFDYTAADFTAWTKEAGFRYVDTMHLNGPASALIAYK